MTRHPCGIFIRFFTVNILLNIAGFSFNPHYLAPIHGFPFIANFLLICVVFQPSDHVTATDGSHSSLEVFLYFSQIFGLALLSLTKSYFYLFQMLTCFVEKDYPLCKNFVFMLYKVSRNKDSRITSLTI